MADNPVGCTNRSLFGVTGDTLKVTGQQTLSFQVEEVFYCHTFLICELPTTAAGILGMDFLESRHAILNLDKYTLSIFRNLETDSYAREAYSRAEGRELITQTLFSENLRLDNRAERKFCKKGQIEILKNETSERKEISAAKDKQIMISFANESWLVQSRETVTIEPRSKQVVKGKLVGEKHQVSPNLVCVEPAHLPIEGMCVARVLTRVHANRDTNQQPDSKVAVSRTQTATHMLRTNNDLEAKDKAVQGASYSSGTVLLSVANFSDEKLILPKATNLGIAQEISENLIVSMDEEKEVRTNSVPSYALKESHSSKTSKFRDYLDGKLAHLSPEDRDIIEPVLVRYAHIFHDDEDNDFKSTKVIEHSIDTGDARPIRKAQYRVPFALRDEMERQVQDMLKKGVIRDSNSPWSAPVILVPKKSVDGKPKYRFCVDFRALNAVTKFDSYPLPRFEETTSTLAGSQYFSVLDCYSGFWQIAIREQDKEKTAFTVPSGHYEFNRLCYGLSNSPSSFQRLVDLVLKNLKGTECWVYIDDIILFGKTAEEHAERLAHVLERLEKANLQLQPSKCVFASNQVDYLGHVISKEGIKASPEKVKAIREYPIPRTVKDVRAFLGLASYYRRLVPRFAEIAKPLSELTRKDVKFEWSPECRKAFETLKEKLSTTPVLAYPDFGAPFILTTDGSSIAVAAVLSQVQGGQERSIAYASRKLNKAERAYSASELEMLALVWATKYFRCYLYGRKFLVRTDHAALRFLHQFADNNSRLMRWSLRLADFDFVVEHRAGSKIAHADALSRHVRAVEEGLTLTKVKLS
jgi:hypothetical protein